MVNLLVILLCFHGDLELRIQQATIEIIQAPDSSYLYYKRGKLYFEHEQYDKCIGDITTAHLKGYDNSLSHLLLCDAYLKNKEPRLAHTILIRYNSNQNKSYLSEKLQGDIHYYDKDFQSAGLAYEQSLLLALNPKPEYYIKTSNAYNRVGTIESNEKAIAILIKAIDHFGLISTLNESLKTIYLSLGKIEDAITLETKWSEIAERKEFTYLELARLYKLKGDKSKSKYYLLAAKTSISQLNKNHLYTSSIQSLQVDIQILEQELINNP